MSPSLIDPSAPLQGIIRPRNKPGDLELTREGFPLGGDGNAMPRLLGTRQHHSRGAGGAGGAASRSRFDTVGKAPRRGGLERRRSPEIRLQAS